MNFILKFKKETNQTLRTIIKEKYRSLLKVEYNNYGCVEQLSIPVNPHNNHQVYL